MKVARTVLKERCPQVIEASTLIKNLQDRAQILNFIVSFFGRKTKNHNFGMYSLYSFKGHLAGFYIYPISTPTIIIRSKLCQLMKKVIFTSESPTCHRNILEQIIINYLPLNLYE